MVRRLAILFGVLGLSVPNAALADAKAGEAKAILCDLCHNVSAGGKVPLLQGQPVPYIEAQLNAFKQGHRKDDAMQTNASGMSAEDMRDIAEYFGSQNQPRTTFRADAAKVALGRERAEQLGCASCHQADYLGRDSTPRLAGQWADYLKTQFKNFRSNARSHGGAAATDIRRNPTIEDAGVLAHFFAALQ
jgi:cytochrome c553